MCSVWRWFIKAKHVADDKLLMKMCLLILLFLLNTALQLLMQSFGLLSHSFPSFSILDKGLPIWHIHSLTSSSQSVFGLPIGLIDMGFQECIALTILASCILSIWLYHPTFALWWCLLRSNALLFYPIPDWFLFAILHFHKMGHILFSKISFQRPLIYWVLYF